MRHINRLNMKRLIVGGIFCASIACSVSSFAACTRSTTVIQNFNFPDSIVVQRDLSVGEVFYSQQMSISPGYVFTCNTNGNAGTNSYVNDWSANSERIAETNVPGVGIRVDLGGVKYPGPSTFNTGGIVLTSGFKVELIKTGDISPEKLQAGTYVESRVTGQFTWARLTNSGSGGNIVPVACSVTNTAIQVPMGTVGRSDFSGVGRPLNEQSFTVPLDCDADTRVNITIDGVADGSGVAGVLALDSSASDTVATGIGLQVLHSGVPVTLGTPIAIGTVASDGFYSVPMTARYYQTAATVTAGQANSTATFTMTYN